MFLHVAGEAVGKHVVFGRIEVHLVSAVRTYSHALAHVADAAHGMAGAHGGVEFVGRLAAAFNRQQCVCSLAVVQLRPGLHQRRGEWIAHKRPIGLHGFLVLTHAGGVVVVVQQVAPTVPELLPLRRLLRIQKPRLLVGQVPTSSALQNLRARHTGQEVFPEPLREGERPSVALDLDHGVEEVGEELKHLHPQQPRSFPLWSGA
mmetsp:Transcript_13354/g.22240  ORF Transcript_13354/g.22240 Transcript_13354/m.22240 type:complete len:204 (-) Transcript_13354:1291-1902(-)